MGSGASKVRYGSRWQRTTKDSLIKAFLKIIREEVILTGGPETLKTPMGPNRSPTRSILLRSGKIYSYLEVFVGINQRNKDFKELCALEPPFEKDVLRGSNLNLSYCLGWPLLRGTPLSLGQRRKEKLQLFIVAISLHWIWFLGEVRNEVWLQIEITDVFHYVTVEGLQITVFAQGRVGWAGSLKSLSVLRDWAKNGSSIVVKNAVAIPLWNLR